MANSTCTQMLKVCALRALRLSSTGTVAAGASNKYTLASPIALRYTEVRPDRERLEQTNGCGDNCGLYIGPSRAVDSVTLETDLCGLDAEFIELLCGGAVITNGTYGTIGYKAATDSTVNLNGVAIETWAMQWNGRQRATYLGQPAWYRHVFPLTKWQPGQIEQSNAFATIPLTGEGEVNSGFATGLAADPTPVAITDAAYMWFIDSAKPTGACGYAAVP